MKIATGGILPETDFQTHRHLVEMSIIIIMRMTAEDILDMQHDQILLMQVRYYFWLMNSIMFIFMSTFRALFPFSNIFGCLFGKLTIFLDHRRYNQPDHIDHPTNHTATSIRSSNDPNVSLIISLIGFAKMDDIIV